jgi:hypothetical protein
MPLSTIHWLVAEARKLADRLSTWAAHASRCRTDSGLSGWNER